MNIIPVRLHMMTDMGTGDFYGTRHMEWNLPIKLETKKDLRDVWRQTRWPNIPVPLTEAIAETVRPWEQATWDHYLLS